MLADNRIREEDVNIKLSNEILTWDKEITWPYLKDSSNSFLRNQFKNTLIQKSTVDHTINRKQRDEIIDDPTYQSYLDDWKNYMNRSEALTVLKKSYLELTMEQIDMFSLLVRRFKIDIQDFLVDFQNFLKFYH